MILLNGIWKSYVAGEDVLKDITFDVQRGEFVYVLGGTGAGKSTLLRMLATEESPNRGQIKLFGYSLTKLAPTTLKAIRRSIGYIPQNGRLLPDLSVFDNIAMAMASIGHRYLNAEGRRQIQQTIQRLNLTAKTDVPCSALSGGEAQRVAVARALVRKPELIIADEPTGAQDAESTWAIMDLFSRANREGTTVILATHNYDIVRRVRNRCATLSAGRVSFREAQCIY